ncbi:MAG: hypothetical protein NUW37_11285 [Planctomycetes bacterium]|nr:hypothetical protein [Planctomycetota bacterium]
MTKAQLFTTVSRREIDRRETPGALAVLDLKARFDFLGCKTDIFSLAVYQGNELANADFLSDQLRQLEIRGDDFITIDDWRQAALLKDFKLPVLADLRTMKIPDDPAAHSDGFPFVSDVASASAVDFYLLANERQRVYVAACLIFAGGDPFSLYGSVIPDGPAMAAEFEEFVRNPRKRISMDTGVHEVFARAALIKRNSDLQKENLDLRHRVDSSEERAQTAEINLRKVRDDLLERKEEIGLLRSQISKTSQEKLDALAQEADELRTRFASKEAELRALAESEGRELAKLKTDIGALRDVLRKEADDHQKKRADLEKQIDEFKQREARIEQQKSEALDEITKLVEEFETNIEAFQKLLDKNEVTIKDLEFQLADKDKEIARLRDELAVRKDETAKRDAEVAAKKSARKVETTTSGRSNPR